MPTVFVVVYDSTSCTGRPWQEVEVFASEAGAVAYIKTREGEGWKRVAPRKWEHQASGSSFVVWAKEVR